MKRLVAIGEALIDFIPNKKGQRLKDVESFRRVAGGAPANVAGAVAKLGGQATFLTALGQDAFGDYIIESLKESNIHTDAITRLHDYDTSLAFVSLADDGNRDFKFYRRTAADLQFSPENIPHDILNNAGFIHFCSVDLVESPMKQAHKKLIDMALQNNVYVSFDPNLRLSLWDDHEALKQTVNEFLPLAHVVKISDEELEFITGYTSIEEALPTLIQGNTEMVIYTKGKDGASLYRKDEHIFVEGNTVDVVDTTGAGDSFIGSFLYYILKEDTDLSTISSETLKSCLYHANAYAACTTTREGALASMANQEEFQTFLTTIK